MQGFVQITATRVVAPYTLPGPHPCDYLRAHLGVQWSGAQVTPVNAPLRTAHGGSSNLPARGLEFPNAKGSQSHQGELNCTECNCHMRSLAGSNKTKQTSEVQVYCSDHNMGASMLASEMMVVYPRLIEVTNNPEGVGHMLIHLNARTWAEDSDSLAADIKRSQKDGMSLLLCHEFPSLIDPDNRTRYALDFKQIMEMTPEDLM
eukprot:5745992-Prymnesium_polylepis.1